MVLMIVILKKYFKALSEDMKITMIIRILE